MSFILTFIACLALQVLIQRRTGAPFQLAFRLSRGVASIGLAAVGYFALIYWSRLWRDAYLVHESGSLARTLVFIPLGHFAADFVLLGWAYVSHREKPRLDLCAHHGLGVIAGLVVLVYGISQELYLVLFTTEIMPITTAISALGLLRAQPALERLGARLRLLTLIAWRLPLWIAVGVLIFDNLFFRSPDPLRGFGLRIGLFFLVFTLTLDVVWTRATVKALRRMNAQGLPAPAKA